MGTLQPGDLPPVVDVESTDGVSASTRANKLRQWLNRVESVTGVKPIIYTGGYFWDDNVGQDFSAYKLWHAGYTGGSCPSTVSRYWPTWTIWQYTSSGSVAGISGNVDMNRFNGTMTQLNQLGLPSCTPSAEVCNGVDDNCDGVADEGATCTPRDEAIFGAALFDSASSEDVDGDGTAGVCARAAAGLVCSLSSGGEPIATPMSTTSFADENGWDDVTNYSTLRLGDVTGDGKDDICARAAAGFRCHLSTGIAFGDAVAGDFFANADGFADPSKFGTIRMADIDGDGKLDACARAAAGVECHRFVDDGQGGGSWSAAVAGSPWSDAHGFDKVQYWSTLRFADLDGDHKDEAGSARAGGARR